MHPGKSLRLFHFDLAPLLTDDSMQTFWVLFVLLLSCGSQVQLRPLHSWDVDIYFGPKQAQLPSGNFVNIFDNAVEDESPTARQISTPAPVATATLASSINIQIPTNANVSLTFGNAGISGGFSAFSTEASQTAWTSTPIPARPISTANAVVVVNPFKASGTEVESSSSMTAFSTPSSIALTTASPPVPTTLSATTGTDSDTSPTGSVEELKSSSTTTEASTQSSTDLTTASTSAPIPVTTAKLPFAAENAVKASTGPTDLPMTSTDLVSSGTVTVNSVTSSTDPTTASASSDTSAGTPPAIFSTSSPSQEVTAPLSDASEGHGTTTISNRIDVASTTLSLESTSTQFTAPSIDLTSASGISNTSTGASADVSNTSSPSQEVTAPLSDASEGLGTTPSSNRIEVASSSLSAESSTAGSDFRTPSSAVSTASSSTAASVSATTGTGSQNRKPSRSQNKSNARITTTAGDLVATSTASTVAVAAEPLAGSAVAVAPDPAQYILQNYGSGFALIRIAARPGSAMPLASPFSGISSVAQNSGQVPFSGLALVIPGGAEAGVIGSNVGANVGAISGVANAPLPTGFGPGSFLNPSTIRGGFLGPAGSVPAAPVDPGTGFEGPAF